MDQIIEYIFAKPVNQDYYEFGINTIEVTKWINRDDLRHFISNNISQDLISIREIRELVEGYEPFIIDNVKKEFYTLGLETSKHEITKVIKSQDLLKKELSMFDKVMNKIKNDSNLLDKK